MVNSRTQQPAGSSKSPEQVIYTIRKRYYQEDVPTDLEELDMAEQNMRQAMYEMGWHEHSFILKPQLE